MGQGSSLPVGLEPDGRYPDDSDAQIAPKRPSPPIAVRKSKSSSQQEKQSTVRRKPKSSQSSTTSLSTPSSDEDPNHVSHRNSKLTVKRKRKPSQSRNSPSAASPETRPGSAKRKRLIDSLSNDNIPTAKRTNGLGPSNAQNIPKSQHGESSTHRPKSQASSVIRRDHQPSPSPALSVGSSRAKGRLRRSNGDNERGKTGAFEREEVEALENYKVQYCNDHGCSTTTFDLMVQHGKEGPFPGPAGVNKRAFWHKVRDILPDRERRSVYRFMKRHFQPSGQKAHEWTEAQEDELVQLYEIHGPKFTLIAEMLGRGSDDVVQRWKNRLEHRDTMKTGPWSEEEIRQLKAALRAAWSKLREAGCDVGQNIFEWDESMISWGQISASLGHVRSRQQCADKWRRYKNFAVVPTSQSYSRATSRGRSVTPAKITKSKGHHPAPSRKSAAYIFDSSDESEPESGAQPTSSKLSDGQDAALGPQPSKQSSPNKKNSSREETRAIQSSDTETESSSDSSSDAESNVGESSKPALREVYKQEASEDTSSDESSDTSSSEEESENKDEIRTTSSTKPAPAESSKRKRTGSSARKSGTPYGKRVKVKKEPSPTPSAVASHDSGIDSDSESDDESTSGGKNGATAIRKRASSSESESKTNSDSESDNGRKVAIKTSPGEQMGQARTAINQSGSSADSTSSDDSDATDSSDDPEDEGDVKVSAIGMESDNDSEDAKESSSSSSDESDSDSESESSSDSE
ncbi:hypothetical protein BDW74DRAFT_150987 [Aspergillus multicolor]|uniref:MYB DNA-binding domain protein n=1 Tax=Aspergillus multicolor TaxID=41759 RepID=UPI003CCE3B64